jgi:hypothetical protein
MKFVCLLLFILVFKESNCQNEKTSSDTKISVGLNFSPEICYRTLKDNSGNSNINNLIDLKNKWEEPGFGFTTGVNVRYHISQIFLIEGALQYLNFKYKNTFDSTGLNFGDMIDPRYGFIYPTVGAVNHFHYLNLPLKFKVRFGKSKIMFISGAGITPGILLKNIDPLEEYNSFNLFSSISAGIEYNINENISLNIEPQFNYGVLKINEYDVTEHLWHGGINFACYYNLK